MKYFCYFIFVLSIGCSKVYEVEKKRGLYYIQNMDLELSAPKTIDWDVGRKREKTVSKGLRFSATLPYLSDKSKSILRKKGGIDSWLVKVSRVKRGSAQALEYFHINIANITRSTKDFTVNLYYHAAAVSKRFRMFHCPAFNHRSKISKYSIADRSGISTNKNMYVMATNKYAGRSSQLRFAPIIMSGGRSLKGVYHVDMSLYNSKTKVRHSKWFPVKGALHVTQELPVAISSCSGIKEEHRILPESEMPTLRDLEIK